MFKGPDPDSPDVYYELIAEPDLLSEGGSRYMSAIPHNLFPP